MHEYGHALTARYYGVKTKDIIISPIGGVARLEFLPHKPIHELVIALAGPAVNVVIAVFLALILFLGGEMKLDHIADADFLLFASWQDFVKYIIVMNLALFTFNLVPAFPMDGGRVLRSLLSIWLGRLKGTNIAARVGQLLAIGFSAVGIYFGHIVLAVIGIFIFFAASSEARQVRISEFLQGSKVKDIMRYQFTPLFLNENFQKPIQLLIRNIEKNFLVADENNQIVGTLPELFVHDVIKRQAADTLIADFYVDHVVYASPSMALLDLFNLMNREGLSIVAVEDEKQIIGVVDRSSLSNAIEINMGRRFLA